MLAQFRPQRARVEAQQARGALGSVNAAARGDQRPVEVVRHDRIQRFQRCPGLVEGSRGLALFYVELAGEGGRREGVLINRLKDKLGTRKLPTAEITLDGVLATPVTGLSNGVRAIAPMLNVTRTWNAISAIAGMRRGLALARSYAQSRVQFGTTLAEKPLHMDTLGVIDAWVENQKSPDRIVARRPLPGGGQRTRPLCPYPQVARYRGQGSTDDERNFECSAPAPR